MLPKVRLQFAETLKVKVTLLLQLFTIGKVLLELMNALRFWYGV
jgi:hypothetical protein